MRRTSTADRPPFFGPTFPTYPPLRQLIKVVSNAGGGLYNAQVVQCQPAGPVFRARETCYLFEPNGLTLNANDIYKSRLVGSNAGLPLFATSVLCCKQSSSSLSVLPKAKSSLSSVSSSPAAAVMSSSFSVPSGTCGPCGPLPNVLHITFSFFSDPTCEGLTVELDIVGFFTWSGSHLFGGGGGGGGDDSSSSSVTAACPTDIVFYCDIPTQTYALSLTNPQTGMMIYAAPLFSCTPLFVVFTPIRGSFPDSCCLGAQTDATQATVTL